MFLGLDASTQSLTAIIVDPDSARVVAEESVNYGRDLPEYASPHGFLENEDPAVVHANPLMWVAALELLLGRLVADGVDLCSVQAICGAGQQHATVYLTADFPGVLSGLSARKPLVDQVSPALARSTAPIWMDSSTTAQCRQISDVVGAQRVCAITGSVATERFSGPQIRRFAMDDPEAYAQTAQIHLASSFLASVLAGQSAPIDFGDGAGMNLMSLENLDWDAQIVAATAPDLADKLPPLEKAGSVIGKVAPYFVERFGFSPDCAALTWTGDNPASLVGIGAAEPGTVIISLGTSDTYFSAMPQALTDPGGYGHVFGNPMGGYMSLTCFTNGSLAREKVRQQAGLSWDEFETAALSVPGSKVALPVFVTETTPRMQASGVRTNGWDFQSADGLQQLQRAIEGQFLNMKLHTQWMGVPPEKILLTGGAAQNRKIAQIAANVFHCTVARPRISSTVAMGAALRAAVTTGQDYHALVKQFCAEMDYQVPPTTDAAAYTQATDEVRRMCVKAH